MTIFNLGSINEDHVYRVPHLPVPGETLAAIDASRGLGGKGANMSVAAARAGAHVCHVGAVGPDGAWAVERLLECGVDTRHIATVDDVTGHAIIAVDDAGENQIILLHGANHAIATKDLVAALSGAKIGDYLLFQNETSQQVQAAKTGSDKGLRVCYAAAPFAADAVQAVLPLLDFLILNQVEMEQLRASTGKRPADLGVETVIVTKGAKGCVLYQKSDGWAGRTFDAIKVDPVDTTGAGDTFTGYVLAGLDRGLTIEQAIHLATQAAALMVTRHGTADVIPSLREIQDSGLG